MRFQSERTFNWLFCRDIDTVKELSRVIQAAHLWHVRTDLVSELIALKEEGHWENSLRDTARAASALAADAIISPDVSNWMLSKQKDMAWNSDVYDTAYVLTALADMGIHNRKGCLWLIENYGPAWEHPGTTALMINALIKQGKLSKKDSSGFNRFINERAEWILSKRVEEGAWKNLATSNIVIQALILAGYGNKCGKALQWLLDSMNANGSWGKGKGDINTTALTLITLASFEKM
ncbi:hypothetical protein [Methanolobus halotolerans]|uniref:Prenyltransferase and squalene oxidase repeat-containing protein n=1 Tax=Methanolobus halotolerans TaxID=2052935 RepID=A0A4E0PXS3_9EURY|nr:hypothetical protein [Methanolobus halotolerans]TGC10934.1 hypothetical protein CUN85_01910 [Methanolobus halotolerans]